MTFPEPQGYYPRDGSEKTSSYAIISLICGFLAWGGVFGLGGMLAVIFGHLAQKEIREGMGSIVGGGMATAGLVLGYTNVIISLIGLCFLAFMLLGIFSTPLFCIPFANEFNTGFTTIP